MNFIKILSTRAGLVRISKCMSNMKMRINYEELINIQEDAVLEHCGFFVLNFVLICNLCLNVCLLCRG